VVQFVGDGLGAMLESDEVENVMVDVQVPLDLDGGAVVVAVQPLAPVPLVADEMPAAKDQVVLGDADFVALGHS
jgi:hypothetical protein